MTRYAKSNQETLQERVHKFYLKNQSRGKKFHIFAF